VAENPRPGGRTAERLLQRRAASRRQLRGRRRVLSSFHMRLRARVRSGRARRQAGRERKCRLAAWLQQLRLERQADCWGARLLDHPGLGWRRLRGLGEMGQQPHSRSVLSGPAPAQARREREHPVAEGLRGRRVLRLQLLVLPPHRWARLLRPPNLRRRLLPGGSRRPDGGRQRGASAVAGKVDASGNLLWQHFYYQPSTTQYFSSST
jgi:hypothetical protein